MTSGCNGVKMWRSINWQLVMDWPSNVLASLIAFCLIRENAREKGSGSSVWRNKDAEVPRLPHLCNMFVVCVYCLSNISLPGCTTRHLHTGKTSGMQANFFFFFLVLQSWRLQVRIKSWIVTKMLDQTASLCTYVGRWFCGHTYKWAHGIKVLFI